MNFPIDFENRMKNMLGAEYEDFKTAFDRPENHIAIRINTAKKGAKEAVLKVTGELRQVAWCSDGYYADKSVISGNHPYHMAGLFYFQEPSAMCAVSAIQISPDDKVLDLCAAPGGKSTQAGALLGENGLLVSNEIVPKRAGILAENIERFGIKNALVTNESPDKLEKRFPCFFDKIIVDAPCSGEGMFRKEPQAIDEWSIAHTNSCADRQLLILNSAEKMLAPNGYIVYSTCTFAPCENEGVIDKFLNEHTDFELVPIDNLDMLSDGVGAWADSERNMSGTKRIFPHKADGEGHFVALLHKVGGESAEIKNTSKEQKGLKEAVSLYKKFEKDTLTRSFDGDFVLFGDNLYLLPAGIGNVDKIKVVRAGLHLGVCKKGRFEPSHALCLALETHDFKNNADYPCNSKEIADYMSGATLESDACGWVCVSVDGFPLGWGKSSGGIIKNHFPKYLRIKNF